MADNDGSKQDGPQFLGKPGKGDDTPAQPKRDYTALTPPGASAAGVPGHTPLGANALHQAQAAAARTEDKLREEAKAGPEEPVATEEEVQQEVDLDAMMQGALAQNQFRELLMTDEQKKLVEERIEPLKLQQMYELGEFRQVIPIVPNEFEAEYRSITPEEDLEIKQMMGKEPEDVSYRYLQDKYATISMLCALRRINETTLPEHFTNRGGWDTAAFTEKCKIIMRMPNQAVWSLMVHNIWFDERCRAVFKLEDLKNG
jgi:hypothetical protein